jgi:hypothetical protein
MFKTAKEISLSNWTEQISQAILISTNLSRSQMELFGLIPTLYQPVPYILTISFSFFLNSKIDVKTPTPC